MFDVGNPIINLPFGDGNHTSNLWWFLDGLSSKFSHAWWRRGQFTSTMNVKKWGRHCCLQFPSYWYPKYMCIINCW
jgi:hypothetical protein